MAPITYHPPYTLHKESRQLASSILQLSPPAENDIIRRHHPASAQLPVPRRVLILVEAQPAVKGQPAAVALEAREHHLVHARDVAGHPAGVGHEYPAESGPFFFFGLSPVKGKFPVSY